MWKIEAENQWLTPDDWLTNVWMECEWFYEKLAKPASNHKNSEKKIHRHRVECISRLRLLYGEKIGFSIDFLALMAIWTKQRVDRKCKGSGKQRNQLTATIQLNKPKFFSSGCQFIPDRLFSEMRSLFFSPLSDNKLCKNTTHQHKIFQNEISC